MKKSKFSESSMVRAVQQLESGVTADITCRELGISRQTLYTWRSKYSGMEISQVKKMKKLEKENRRLKQKYADLSLDYHILKDFIVKNSRVRGQEGTGRRDIDRRRHQHRSGVQDYGYPQIFLLLPDREG